MLDCCWWPDRPRPTCQLIVNGTNLGGLGSPRPLGRTPAPGFVDVPRTPLPRPRATRPVHTGRRRGQPTRRSSCEPHADVRHRPGRGGGSLSFCAPDVCGRARRSKSRLGRRLSVRRSRSSAVVAGQGLKAVPFPPAPRRRMGLRPGSGLRRGCSACRSTHATPVP